MSYKEKVMSKVVSVLKSSKGVHVTCELSKDDRKIILQLEKEAEKRVLGGLGRSFNAGLRRALEREVLIVFLHDENYEWPPETVQLICMGEVIGEEIRTKEKLQEVKEKGDAILAGDTFVLYKDKVRQLGGVSSGLAYFLFPPLTIPELKEVNEICNVVAAMPCTPGDMCIKEIMKRQGVNVLNPKLGTALVGFNILYP